MGKVSGSWLITGATGYLGTLLVQKLIATTEYSLICLVRNSSSVERFPKTERIQFIYELPNELEVDGVLHLATLYKSEKDEDIEYVNFLLPKHLAGLDIKYFVAADSSLPAHLNSYAKYKHELRDYLKSRNDIVVANLILEQFYGKGDGRFVSFLVKHLKEQSPEIPLTAGEQERDFVYVSDVVEAFCLVMNMLPQLDSGYHEYEVGSGEALSIRKIVEWLKELSGNERTHLAFGKVPYREGEVMHSVANKKKWPPNWKPLVSLEQGLRNCLGD